MAARLLPLALGLVALAAAACGGGDSSGPSTTPTTTPEFAGFSVTLERGACFGACPIYTVTVRGDGSVTYSGERYVAVTGDQTAKASTDGIRRLAQEIHDIDYFSLANEYPCGATDIPTYITTVTLNGETKSISACSGSGGNLSNTPLELHKFEDLIDVVAGTAKWIEPALAGFSITLDRTDCMGSCPSYAVTVSGDGSVTYNGRLFVEVTGEKTATVSLDDVRRLVAKVEEIGFFTLAVPTVASGNVCTATDIPGYTTTVSLRTQQWQLAHCPSSGTESGGLKELEDLIDEVAGTSEWIGGLR
jgi:hypothetical protein